MSPVVVEQTELKRLVSAIKEYAPPRQILLFGSRANGTQKTDSDFDLCVIYENLPKRALEVLQDLYGTIFQISRHPVDLVVYQADKFQNRAALPGSFEATIATHGQVIFGQA